MHLGDTQIKYCKFPSKSHVLCHIASNNRYIQHRKTHDHALPEPPAARLVVLGLDGLEEALIGVEAVQSNRLGRTLRALSDVGIEDLLTKTDRLGSDLDDFIIAHVRDHIFEGEAARRGELGLLILHDTAHVGDSLGLGGVDLDIVFSAVFTDDHAGVDLGVGFNEECTTILDHFEGIGSADTVFHGENGTLAGTLDLTAELDVLVESGGDDTLTASIVHELVTETEETTSRDVEDESNAAIREGNEFLHLTTTLGHLLDDVTGHGLLDIDGDLFDGLEKGLVLLIKLEDDLRGRHSELVTLTTNSLDDDTELQFTTGADLDRILVRTVEDANGHVVLSLAVETLAQGVGGVGSALATGERRVVDGEGHGQGRGVDGDGGDDLGDGRVAEGGVDGCGAETGERDDITGGGLINDVTVHTSSTEELENLGVFDDLTLFIKGLDRVTRAHDAVDDTTDKTLTEESIRLDLSDEHAEGSLRVALGSRDVLEDALEEGVHVSTDLIGSLSRPTGAAGGVDDGVLELLVVGIKVDEHIEDLVLHDQGPS